MERVGILIAVESEAHAVLESKELAFVRNGNGSWSSSRYPYDLMLSGVGKVLAAHALMSLAGMGSHTWYWSLGTSGSLGAEPVGSMYFCAKFAEWDMDIRPLGFPRGVTAYENQREVLYETMEEKQIGKLASLVGCGRAIAVSGDSFIADNKLAEELKKDFGASLPLLADMESAAVAKLCSLRLKKPFCALRWVSDNANKDSGNNWKENVTRASLDFASVLERVGTHLVKDKGIW